MKRAGISAAGGLRESPVCGVAFGVDRMVAQFVGAKSIRDVIAFPKTTAARALFEGAPTPVSDAELEELRLTVTRRLTGATPTVD